MCVYSHSSEHLDVGVGMLSCVFTTLVPDYLEVDQKMLQLTLAPRGRQVPAQNTTFFFEFSLCSFRACLGKLIVFYI